MTSNQLLSDNPCPQYLFPAGSSNIKYRFAICVWVKRRLLTHTNLWQKSWDVLSQPQLSQVAQERSSQVRDQSACSRTSRGVILGFHADLHSRSCSQFPSQQVSLAQAWTQAQISIPRSCHVATCSQGLLVQLGWWQQTVKNLVHDKLLSPRLRLFSRE